MRLYTKTFEEWRKRLGLENFYILGYSLGGYILMHYLMSYKPSVKGVYIVASPGWVKPGYAGKEYVENYVKGYVQGSGSW